MACSSTSPSTPLDGQLARLFAILSQPGMWDTFFKVVDVMFADATPEETDRFTKLFSLLVRYYNVSPGYLTFHINDCLMAAPTPQEMFRTDSISTRMLREFVTQVVSPKLASHLSLLVSSLSLPLPPAATEMAATQLLRRLHQFRFSSEAKAFFVTLGSLIDSRFPGHEWVGISGVFFLRYLCPLILSSPSSFNAEDTPAYEKNCLTLVKALQNLANRTTSLDVTPEILMIRMEQQELMTTFLSRLTSPTDLSGFKIPFSFYSNLAVTTMLDDPQCIALVELILKWVHRFHEDHNSEWDQRWVDFSESWKRYIMEAKDLESLASDSFSSELEEPDPPKATHPQPKNRYTPPFLSFLSFYRKTRGGSQINFRASAVSDFPTERRSSIGTSTGTLFPPTEKRSSPHYPLLSKKASSTPAMHYSPRTESLRTSFALQADSARSWLSSTQAARQHGSDLVQTLGSLTGLAQQIAPSVEQRQVLLAYARLVSHLVDELNAKDVCASTVIDLREVMTRLELTLLIQK